MDEKGIGNRRHTTNMLYTDDYLGGATVRTKPENSPDWARSSIGAPMRKVRYNELGKVLCVMPGSCGTAFLVKHEDWSYAGYWDKEIIVCITREIED